MMIINKWGKRGNYVQGGMNLRLCIKFRLEMGLKVEVLNWQHILQVDYQVIQNGFYSHNSRHLVIEYEF